MPLETAFLILGWGLLGTIIVTAICSGSPPEHGCENEQTANREGDEPPENPKKKDIVGSIDRVAKEFARQRNQDRSERQTDHRWKVAEVLGLWAAALVGLSAVLVANHDAGQQWSVMHGQLDAMISDQRAWVKISASPRSITFDPTSKNAVILFGLRIENVGRSVALQARIEATVIVLPHDKNPLIVLEQTQERFCADKIANPATTNMDITKDGITLFPGEHYPINADDFRASVPLKLDDIIDSTPYMNGKRIGPFFSPYAIGCVTYKLSLGEKRHQTGFIYMVARVDETTNGLPYMLKIGSDLNAPNIRFDAWYWSQGKID